MNKNDFKKNIIDEGIKKFNLPGRYESSSFLMWILENFYELDSDKSIECVCDNPNDKGIDGIYCDDLNEEIYIFQSKYPNSVNYTGDKNLRDFTGVKEWFKNKESVEKLLNSTINNELKSILESEKIVDKIDSYDVKYIFVSCTEEDHNTKEFLLVSDIETFDIDIIMSSYNYISENNYPRGKFTFNTNEGFNFLVNGSTKVGIYKVKASEIVNLSGIVDSSLFSKNVRYKLKSSRVNKEIEKSISKESDNFLLYNNGLTIICNKLKINKENIEITDYAVVNGCQTTSTLFKNKELIDSINIIVRIVELDPDSDLAKNITINTNNQNSISISDLKSDDITQKRLKNEFEELNSIFGTNIFYKNKNGDDGTILKSLTILKKDFVAQLITSTILNESYSTHLKNKLFGDYYVNIFNKNINAKKIFIINLIHDSIVKNISNIKDPKIGSYGLAKFFILGNIFDILRESNEWNIYFNNDNIINNISKFNDNLDKILKSYYNVFNKVILDKKGGDDNGFFDYKNIFKNPTKVKDIASEIKLQFMNGLTFNDTNLDKLIEIK